MVIFHSYVKLPEGNMGEMMKQDEKGCLSEMNNLVDSMGFKFEWDLMELNGDTILIRTYWFCLHPSRLLWIVRWHPRSATQTSWNGSLLCLRWKKNRGWLGSLREDFFRGMGTLPIWREISRRVSNLPLHFAVAFCMLFVSDFLHILFCYLPIGFTSGTELSK